MTLDGGKALSADHVLHPACVFHGSLFGDSQMDEPAGEEGVAFIDGFGDLQAGFGQRDIAVPVHQNVSLAAQIFHGNTDAGLGKLQMICNIDGTYISVFLAEDQNGFQIIFGRFMNLHGISSFQR